MCGRWVGWVGLGGLGGERGRGGIGGGGGRHGKELHVAYTIGCGIMLQGFMNGGFSRWRWVRSVSHGKAMGLVLGWRFLDAAES